jgi:hypothetical protein
VTSATQGLWAACWTAGSDPDASLQGHHVRVGEKRGSLSITVIYLLVMVGMFLLAGFLHLGEFVSLIHGVWYLLGLPSGCKQAHRGPVCVCLGETFFSGWGREWPLLRARVNHL